MSKAIKDKPITIKIEDKEILNAVKRRLEIEGEMDEVRAREAYLRSENRFLRAGIFQFLMKKGYHTASDDVHYSTDNIDKGEIVLKFQEEGDSDHSHSNVKEFLSKLMEVKEQINE